MGNESKHNGLKIAADIVSALVLLCVVLVAMWPFSETWAVDHKDIFVPLIFASMILALASMIWVAARYANYLPTPIITNTAVRAIAVAIGVAILVAGRLLFRYMMGGH